MNQTAKIQLNIMMIAFLGGLAFLCYLLLNVHLANANKHRLDDLLNHHYPVIEKVRHIKSIADNLRENLTAAVALEDGFLVDESAELVEDFRSNSMQLAEMEPHYAETVHKMLDAFDRYYESASQLALILINVEGNLSAYRQRVDETHAEFGAMLQLLDELSKISKQDYESELLLTHSAVINANQIGAVFGTVVLVALVLLAWAISVRVVHEINRTNRLKDAFLATISHELRTPMNGIIGALNLLNGSSVNEEQKSLVNAASISASSMMMSIDDILEFSEIMSGQISVNEAKVDLKTGLEDLLAQFKDDFALQNLRCRWEIDPALAQPAVTDGQKVLHVVRHLVSNGLKFTDQGEVRVSARLEPVAGEDGHARIRIVVADTGPGISDVDMDKLFRPFEQLDSTFRRRHQGMGIGLAICRAVAELLDGHVTLRNRIPNGIEAEFEFRVQLLPQENPTSAIGMLVRPKVVRDPALLMVVEDNPVNQMVMKGYLKKLGYGVVAAANGQEALDLLEEQGVDLILMDCQMPVMDGFEATRRIRSLPEPLAQIPIIAVTANVLDVDREQCLQAGMNAFLKKPVELETIKTALNEFLYASAG